MMPFSIATATNYCRLKNGMEAQYLKAACAEQRYPCEAYGAYTAHPTTSMSGATLRKSNLCIRLKLTISSSRRLRQNEQYTLSPMHVDMRVKIGINGRALAEFRRIADQLGCSAFVRDLLGAKLFTVAVCRFDNIALAKRIINISFGPMSFSNP